MIVQSPSTNYPFYTKASPKLQNLSFSCQWPPYLNDEMMKCMGIVWYNISKNRPRWKRFFCAPGGGVDTFIFSDFEPWNFVIALYKISPCKSHCYSSWAFICSRVELLTRTWALNNFDRSYATGILHNLLQYYEYGVLRSLRSMPLSYSI